jgi:excisionase family DNA binding protein
MGSIDHNTSQLLTVKQLSERLNISTNFIYKRTYLGSADPLPFIPVGRGKRFDLEKVRQHLEARQKKPSSVMFSGTD